jgi:hypothetical protein
MEPIKKFGSPKLSCEPYIQPIPMPASTMASQVRAGKRCPKNTRVISAVSKGPTAMVISTLATAVKVSATMNAVNMTLQHKPENQK